jgi:D-inositol-3-phosphate glycosyltransferase
MPWVRQLGFLDRDRLASLYASADVCVLPSDTETCGLVALEAMASGLAVIAADAGGFRESIIDNVTGLLAAPRDPAEFAAEISALVRHQVWRRELAAAARDAAARRDVVPENLALLDQYAAAADLTQPGAAPCAA